jgi:hydroxyacylglutathione hydrolase
MQLVPLPAFADNYIWVLHHEGEAVVVDPGEAAGVSAWLASHAIRLTHILVTHHHADHTGGVAELQAQHNATVWAPATECPQLAAQRVADGQTLELLGQHWRVMDVPGHTAGHVAYHCTDSPGWLFCGDTLFSGGCGRLFEGTPAQMWASLQTLAALPDDTLVCAAHEYTLSNLRFALAAEPDNAELNDWMHTCQQRRDAGQPTLPSTVGTEKAINPFLRAHRPALQAAAQTWAQQHPEVHARHAGLDAPTRSFALLREWKNLF